MDVCADDFRNAPREEVPDDNAAIVAPHRQQGPPAVECAGEGHADTVQSAICLLTTQIRRRRDQRQSDKQHHHSGMEIWDLTKNWRSKQEKVDNLPRDSSAQTTLEDKEIRVMEPFNQAMQREIKTQSAAELSRELMQTLQRQRSFDSAEMPSCKTLTLIL